jgi:D-sedoheptulose 7-phosphate isomerase
MKIVDEYLEDLKSTIDRIPLVCVDNVISILHTARINRKHVFIMGNGGSASTASHFVCDLAKNTRKSGWPEFRVIGLTDNMAIFSAYANDEGYENVFVQQLNNLLNPGDVVIAISGSGNSNNVIQAVELANKRGAITIGFTGLTGGKLKGLVQHSIYIPNDHIDEVEDIHLVLEHMICRVLMDRDAFKVMKQEPEIILLDEQADEGLGSDELVKELFGNILPFINQSEGIGHINEKSSELLASISREFASKLDLHDLLSRILCLTVEYVGAVGGSVIVLNEEGDVIDGALAYAGQIQEKSTDQLNETIHRGLAGWVFENRQPALVTSTKEDPRWLPRNWETSLDMTRSAICVPLITQDRVIGILTLTRLQAHRFTMEDLSLLTSITLALSYSFTSKAALNYQK